jgi:membrane glycosyltransferase
LVVAILFVGTFHPWYMIERLPLLSSSPFYLLLTDGFLLTCIHHWVVKQLFFFIFCFYQIISVYRLITVVMAMFLITSVLDFCDKVLLNAWLHIFKRQRREQELVYHPLSYLIFLSYKN